MIIQISKFPAVRIYFNPITVPLHSLLGKQLKLLFVEKVQWSFNTGSTETLTELTSQLELDFSMNIRVGVHNFGQNFKHQLEI